MEQVNKLILEGMEQVQKDLLATVEEGSDKYATQVNEKSPVSSRSSTTFTPACETTRTR